MVKSMQKIVLVSVFLAILIGIGAVVVFLGRNADPEQRLADTATTSLPTDSVSTSTTQPELSTEGGPQPHPISLATFAQREFDGRDLTVGRVLAETNQYTRYYITYKSGQLTISGIMNVPKGTPPAGGFPVLILNHGYIDPAVYTNGRGLRREQDYLAQRGYVVIHPDYRNHAESDKDVQAEVNLRLGYVEDVINAIKAVQESDLPYLDKDHIGMLGHSMGGGVAQGIMVAQPDLVDAVVLFAPVSGDMRDNFERWLKRRPEVAERILRTFGSPEEAPEFWDGVSPLTYLKNVSAPVMIHHGTSDDSVPLEWSQRLERELKAQNKEVTFHVYPGEPHEFAAAWPTVMQRTVTFFDQHLKR
jgi:dipeptidyl aminopeptidase/acylaminoacyl peptidase